MLLHISSQAFPILAGAGERREEMKVAVLGGETPELLEIINVLLAPRAEEQPEFASLMSFALRQEPAKHGAKRRNPRSSGNKHGVAQRRAKNEVAEWSLKFDCRAFVKTAEIVRHKSILHAIQAEGDVSGFVRRRSDRIHARDLLPIGGVGLNREPLSRTKAKRGCSVTLKFEVLR